MDGQPPDVNQIRMVERQLKRRGIHDPEVLGAMLRVPRQRFVPEEWTAHAFRDGPLPIGEGQTISQPYIVGLMTQALRLKKGERVLELGTGSGYQTAILVEMGASVWTIERSPCLHAQAQSRLRALGYDAVECIQGDGTVGYAVSAPYDRILATGSLPSIPSSLIEQLAPEGVFVGPVGGYHDQQLVRLTLSSGEENREALCDCRFVPLVGTLGWEQ